MKKPRSVNFIYALFVITLVSATCTFFIIRTTRAVTMKIGENQDRYELVLHGR